MLQTPSQIKQALVPFVVVDQAISLVGSVAAGADDPDDVDILVRWRGKAEDLPESLQQGVAENLDPDRVGRLHYISEPSGPHSTYIPLYDFVFIPYGMEPDGATVYDSGLPGLAESVIDGALHPFEIESDYLYVWDNDGIALWSPVEGVPLLAPLLKLRHIFPGVSVAVGSESGCEPHTAQGSLMAVPRPSLERISVSEPLYAPYTGQSYGGEVHEAIELGKRWQVMKPRQPSTDFFSAEELWEDWAKDVEKVVAEPKYGGFHMLFSVRGNDVEIWTEEAAEDRSEDLPVLARALRTLDEEVMLEGELVATRDGKPVARTELPSVLSGESDATPAVYLFDVVWEGDESLADLPHSARYKALRALVKELPEKHFKLAPERTVGSQQALQDAWEWAKDQPHSEGIILKDDEAEYEEGPSNTLVKQKEFLELAVLVLETIKRENGYTYQSALSNPPEGLKNTVEFEGKQYVNLGRTFVTEEKLAEAGNVIDVRVEELLLLDGGRELAWGKPTAFKKSSRETPYSYEQAVDMARRAGVFMEEAHDLATFLKEARLNRQRMVAEPQVQELVVIEDEDEDAVTVGYETDDGLVLTDMIHWHGSLAEQPYRNRRRKLERYADQQGYRVSPQMPARTEPQVQRAMDVLGDVALKNEGTITTKSFPVALGNIQRKILLGPKMKRMPRGLRSREELLRVLLDVQEEVGDRVEEFDEFPLPTRALKTRTSRQQARDDLRLLAAHYANVKAGKDIKFQGKPITLEQIYKSATNVAKSLIRVNDHPLKQAACE